MPRLVPAALVVFAAFAMACSVAPLSAAPPPAAPLTAPWAGDEGEGPEVKPCVRTEFKTPFLAQACKDGGQKAASKAMQGFVKEVMAELDDVGKVTCKTCHTKLAPDFPLTDDALTRFEDWRERLDARPAPAPADSPAPPTETAPPK